MTAIHTRQYMYYKSAKNYRILQLYSTAVKQCQLKTIFDHWDHTVTLAVMYLEIKPQKKKKVFVFTPFQCAAVNLQSWKARSCLISNKFLSRSLKVLSFSEGRLKNMLPWVHLNWIVDMKIICWTVSLSLLVQCNMYIVKVPYEVTYSYDYKTKEMYFITSFGWNLCSKILT